MEKLWTGYKFKILINIDEYFPFWGGCKGKERRLRGRWLHALWEIFIYVIVTGNLLLWENNTQGTMSFFCQTKRPGLPL